MLTGRGRLQRHWLPPQSLSATINTFSLWDVSCCFGAAVAALVVLRLFTSDRCVVVVASVQTAYTHLHRRRTMASRSAQIILLGIWNEQLQRQRGNKIKKKKEKIEISVRPTLRKEQVIKLGKINKIKFVVSSVYRLNDQLGMNNQSADDDTHSLTRPFAAAVISSFGRTRQEPTIITPLPFSDCSINGNGPHNASVSTIFLSNSKLSKFDVWRVVQRGTGGLGWTQRRNTLRGR